MKNLAKDELGEIGKAICEVDPNKYFVTARRIDKSILLNLYKDGELKIRHLNNGEKMVTETEGGIKPSGLSNYINYWCDVKILEKDKMVIQEWLKENGVGYFSTRNSDFLLEVPSVVNKKKREKAKKRREEKINETFSQIKPIPRSFQDFLDNDLMYERFGFFNREKKTVFVSCCNKELKESEFKKFKSNEMGKCPICGKKIKFRSEKIKFPRFNRTAILSNRLKDGICIRYFDVTYEYLEKGQIKKIIYEFSRDVIDFHGKIKNYTYLYNKEKWWDITTNYFCFKNEAGMYTRNINSVIKNTPYENKGCENLKEVFKKNGYDFAKYLFLINRYPQFELVAKAKLSALVQAFLDTPLNSFYYKATSCINEEGTTVHEFLRIEKRYLKPLREEKSYKKVIRLLQVYAKAGEINLEPEKAEIIATYYLENIEDALPLKIDVLKRIASIIERASKEHPNMYINSRYYFDYMNTVKKLGLPRKRYKYPANLVEAHDKMNEAYKLQKNEILEKRVKERASELKDFVFSTDDYTFVPPKSLDELKEESQKLHHCVYNCYSEKYADGDTNIIFIRQKANKSNPFVTMEVKDNKVIQVRAVNNSTPDDNVLSAVELFKKEKLHA